MRDSKALDEVVAQSHAALEVLVQGDPEPFMALYSHRDDASLANPFGPPAVGWSEVTLTLERAAAHYRDGSLARVERVAGSSTPELAYIVEIEHYEARIDGRTELLPFAVRVTSVLRPEDGLWKFVHRHADPITSPRSADSLLEG